MAVIKVYTRINWLNKSESLTTPLGKTNLNKMDKAINLIDDEVVSMSAKIDEIDTTKVSADQLNNMVTDVSFNDKNGVISITKHNGTVLNIDTAMEKIAVNFEYNAQTQQLILTLENGEKQYIDMSALITQYEFKDTDTIAFSVDSDGKVSASIKSGSITKAMLSSEVMSAITLSENNAAASAQAAAQSATNAELDAKLSQSYSAGKSGIRDGEDTDNSKYYSEQAKKYADEAQEIAGGNFIPDSEKGMAGGVAVLNANLAVEKAVADEDGNNIKDTYATKQQVPDLVKVDNETITKDENGILHGAMSVDVDSELSETSENPVQNKVITKALQEKANTDNVDALNRTITELQENKADKTEVPKLVKVDGTTVFLSEDGVLSAKGGGATITPKPTVNPAIKSDNAKVTITWGDPDDSIIDGIVLSTWKGTKLVMKENGYPENENDGTVILDNTEKDKYKTTGYEVTGLINGNTYYFTLFPYSTDEIYNYQASNRLLGKPSLVRLDPCTDMSIASAMGSATVKWTDPEATKTVDGNTATWAKTVLVYKEGATAPSSPSDGTVAVEETIRNQYQTDGYKVNGLTDGKQYTFALFAISTENSASDSVSANVKLWSTIAISTGETSLYGKDITVSYSENNMTATFDSSGSATVDVPYIGDVTISSTDGSDTANSNVTISAYGNTYSAELSFLKIVTFADGTDEEIAAMIQAHYDNKINIADYWAVGDKRSVNLSAMSATYVGESHRAQTVQFAIADFGKDELSTPINGHTMAAITLTQVNCLMDATSANNSNNGSNDTEKGYMNSTNTNVGGWKGCARRTWCNDVYYNALPSVFKSMVKEVNKKTSAGNQSSTINTTTDKVFLLSEIEIFGTTSYSVSGEGTQYQYYKNATANRYKMPKWGSSSSSHIYWQRSPYSGNSSRFCIVDYSGSAYWYSASSTGGCAPCLCI